MSKNEFEFLFEKLKKDMEEKYKIGVPRAEIGIATGGYLNPQTMANRDTRGVGIPGSFKVGRQRVYPVVGVIQALRDLISTSKTSQTV